MEKTNSLAWATASLLLAIGCGGGAEIGDGTSAGASSSPMPSAGPSLGAPASQEDVPQPNLGQEDMAGDGAMDSPAPAVPPALGPSEEEPGPEPSAMGDDPFNDTPEPPFEPEPEVDEEMPPAEMGPQTPPAEDEGEDEMGDPPDVAPEPEEEMPAPPETEPSGCIGGKVVHFVYFVEADAEYSESQHADIEAQAYAFQQYWYEQLGGTFYLSEPVVDVIEADHDSSWYLETPDGFQNDPRWYRLGNVKNEVLKKLGVRDFDPNHRVVNYPTMRYDGHVGANYGGAWMDGDDLTCIVNGRGSFPYEDSDEAHCLGHPAHEFGHVLGLQHQGPDTDCMQYGFYMSWNGGEMCDFSADNVAQILDAPDNDGWFEAMPGQTCQGT